MSLFFLSSPSFLLFFFHLISHFCELISIILMLIILCVIGPWLMSWKKKKKKLLPQKQLPVQRPSFHVNATYWCLPIYRCHDIHVGRYFWYAVGVQQLKIFSSLHSLVILFGRALHYFQLQCSLFPVLEIGSLFFSPPKLSRLEMSELDELKQVVVEDCLSGWVTCYSAEGHKDPALLCSPHPRPRPLPAGGDEMTHWCLWSSRSPLALAAPQVALQGEEAL